MANKLLLQVWTALATLAYLFSVVFRVVKQPSIFSPVKVGTRTSTSSSFLQCALSRQEGIILLLVCTGARVTRAPRQFLLSGPVCITWPFWWSRGRLHHQALILLLLLLLLAGTCELIGHVDRIRRLRRGQVHLDGRHVVWRQLRAVGLRICRLDKGSISGK